MKHIEIFIPFIASTYIVEREIFSIILNFKPCENVIIPLSAFPLEHNFIILQNLCKFWPFYPTLLSFFWFLLTEVARYINGQKILVQLELCLHFCFSVNLVCNRDQKDKPRLELQVKGWRKQPKSTCPSPPWGMLSLHWSMAKVLTYHTGTLNWHGYCKTRWAVTPRPSWYVWLIIWFCCLFNLFILKYFTWTLFLQWLVLDFLWMPKLLVFFSTLLSLRHRDKKLDWNLFCYFSRLQTLAQLTTISMKQ